MVSNEWAASFEFIEIPFIKWKPDAGAIAHPWIQVHSIDYSTIYPHTISTFLSTNRRNEAIIILDLLLRQTSENAFVAAFFSLSLGKQIIKRETNVSFSFIRSFDPFHPCSFFFCQWTNGEQKVACRNNWPSRERLFFLFLFKWNEMFAHFPLC